MYTDKRNILQLAALLKEHGIRNVVLCPGSRNIPIVQTLANMADFSCHAVTDERSAGFFALGLALHAGAPAAVCCTSGTALLNLHPAVAEAFYQQVPLVVISADRPQAWIGQMDGQTLPQPGVFGTLVKKSVNLPEVQTDEDEWYCNRLINEALLELNHHGKGPVHINVPVSEPFFKLPVTELPEVRVISRYQGLNVYDKDYRPLIERMNRYRRRMAVAGQMNLIYLFDKRYASWNLRDVHERVTFPDTLWPAPVGGLLMHNRRASAAEHRRKETEYAVLEARVLVASGVRPTFVGAYMRAAAAYLRSYIFRRGFLDGREGREIARTAAAMRLVTYKMAKKAGRKLAERAKQTK